MKVVLLAGGLGTRISEESDVRPKPMIEIGGKPILWHIMKHYSVYGFNEFIICLGYKGYLIKEYFANYFLHQSDVTFDLGNNTTTIHSSVSESWKVTLVDTGLNTMTGGRVRRIRPYVGNESFMLTYGDGVSDVNLNELVALHKKSSADVTMTAFQPEGRFGILDINNGDVITRFSEKPKGDGSWINGGFMILEPTIFDYLDSDESILERTPLEMIAKNGKIVAYRHEGFWHCMDTLRDKTQLESLWNQGKASWKTWD